MPTRTVCESSRVTRFAMSKKLDAAPSRFRLLKKLTAGAGERHAVAMPHEQTNPELFFELANVPAQRWLGDVEAFGCLGDARLVGNRDEGAQMSKIHGGPILYQIGIPPAVTKSPSGSPRSCASCARAPTSGSTSSTSELERNPDFCVCV